MPNTMDLFLRSYRDHGTLAATAYVGFVQLDVAEQWAESLSLGPG